MANLYHETQKFNMCGMHCLNNFLQRPEFNQDMLDKATPPRLEPTAPTAVATFGA